MAKSAKGIVARARMFKGVVRKVVTGKIVMKVAYGVIRWEEDAPEYESLL